MSSRVWLSSSSTASSSSRSRSRPPYSSLMRPVWPRARDRGPTDLAQTRSTAATAFVDELRVVVPHPDDARVLAEPRVLAAGEPPGRGAVRSRASSLGELAARGGPPPRGSRSRGTRCGPRPGRRRAGGATSSTKPPVEHRVDPRGDPLGRASARSMSTPIWTVCGSTYSRRGQAGAERPPGQLDHLEGADDPAAVLGKDPRGGLGVALGQHACSACGARLGELGLPAGRGPPRRCRGTRTGRGSRGCRAPSRRPAPASYAAPRSRSMTSRAQRLELRDGGRLADGRACRAGGAGCRAARGRAASRCRRPCRGRPASRRC